MSKVFAFVVEEAQPVFNICHRIFYFLRDSPMVRITIVN